MGDYFARLRAPGALALISVSLASCVSLAGSQDRIIDPRDLNSGLPGLSIRHVLREYYQPTTIVTRTRPTEDGTETVVTLTPTPSEGRLSRVQQELRGNRTRREWRDYVVGVYEMAINANYLGFSGRVSSEQREVGLGADAVINGFTTYATVARTSIVSELSAAAAAFVGLRGAVDRNLYSDRAAFALRASMDAERARIRAQIANGLAQNEDAYSLRAAMADLQRLEEAGSLDVAVGEITRAAAEQRQLANQELATAVQVCEVVDDDVIDLVDRLGTFADDLADSSKATATDTLVARTQALQQMGRLAGLSSDMMISTPPTQIAALIGQQLVRGQNGRCATANYRALLERIEAETQRTVPQ